MVLKITFFKISIKIVPGLPAYEFAWNFLSLFFKLCENQVITIKSALFSLKNKQIKTQQKII